MKEGIGKGVKVKVDEREKGQRGGWQTREGHVRPVGVKMG